MKQHLFAALFALLGLTATSMAQNKLSPGDHYATINGLTMHYFVEGHGPVCLFPSPGWGISMDYAKHMKPLVNHFTMVLYDTRLSGATSGPADYTRYTGAYFTNDMDSLREYLGQEKVWIAGHSGGGFQVLRYSIYHSDHLNGVIAIGALACADSLYMSEMMRMIQKRSDAPYYTARRANMFMGTDTTYVPLKPLLTEIFPFYFYDQTKLNQFPAGYTLNDSVERYTTKAGLFMENLLPDLPKVTVPVLLILGDDDIICNLVSQSARAYQQLSWSSLSVINNSGHCPWIEQPQAFTVAVEAWLKDMMPRQAGKQRPIKTGQSK